MSDDAATLDQKRAATLDCVRGTRLCALVYLKDDRDGGTYGTSGFTDGTMWDNSPESFVLFAASVLAARAISSGIHAEEALQLLTETAAAFVSEGAGG